MKLPKDTAEHFELATELKGGPKFDFGPYGTIDFSKLTLARAERLVKAKFPHLRKRGGKELAKSDAGKKGS